MNNSIAKQKTGTLYLIPCHLGETNLDNILPQNNIVQTLTLKHFIVENIRTARRFLKMNSREMDIDSLTFYELNKHTDLNKITTYIAPLLDGIDVGLISEAGCPAVADPGADVVALAQERGLKVVPMVGPSSILLSLMGSGFNGQGFTFLGYLPIQQQDRTRVLKNIESRIYSENQTQIFIETPYRNMKMLSDIVSNCKPLTKLCIAADLTLPTEFIQTKTLKDWKKNLPQIDKRPTVFLLYK